MRIPIIRGLIDRRLLINYRCDPERLARLLPSPFRPLLVNGQGMAGICLIRLKQVRPRFWPGFLGIQSENAAHRIAVEWEQDGTLRQGVYIPRRDTSSWLNTLGGGRLFPGCHHHARFHVREDSTRLSVQMDSDDGQTHVAVRGRVADTLPTGSLFSDVESASAFFARGALGYSPTRRPGTFDGLELRTFNWQVEPLAVDEVTSSFFASELPAGAAVFDCALLMRHIEHEWHGRATLCTDSAVAGAAHPACPGRPRVFLGS